MKRREYKFIPVDKHMEVDAIIKQVNKAAEDGWIIIFAPKFLRSKGILMERKCRK